MSYNDNHVLYKGGSYVNLDIRLHSCGKRLYFGIQQVASY